MAHLMIVEKTRTGTPSVLAVDTSPRGPITIRLSLQNAAFLDSMSAIGITLQAKFARELRDFLNQWVRD